MGGRVEVSFQPGIISGLYLQPSIIFANNTVVSRMTPECIILYFSSIIPQTLILGKKNRRRKESRQDKQKTGTRECCKMSDDQYKVIIPTGRGLNIGPPPRGWNLEEENNITQQIFLRKHRAHCSEGNSTIGQIATPNLISLPGLNRIQSTKPNPHLQAATVSACYFFPRKKCGR